MRVWLITTGEPLPTDSYNPRLLRTGYLAQFLGLKGHQVVWWTSNFDHVKKRKRYLKEISIKCWPGVEIRLLDAPYYTRNISFARMINHAVTARRFIDQAKYYKKPDVIICAFPTIELGYAAVKYGCQGGVPVLLDIRDLWPDVIVNILPFPLKVLGRLALSSLFAKTQYAFENAYALLAVSEKYLRWGLGYARRDRKSLDEVIPIGCKRITCSRKTIVEAEKSLKAKGVDPTKVVCWFIGSFGKTYDLGTLIEVARRLKQNKISNIQFVFSGAGEMKDEWVRKANGLKHVVFTGWIGTNEIACLSRFATFGLQAYAHGAPQGLANKLYDYLEAGLPILSSLPGENEELLKKYNCGLTYAAGDPEDFRRKLNQLITNKKLLKRMKTNAVRLFNSNFRMETVCGNLEKHLIKISESYKWCKKKK